MWFNGPTAIVLGAGFGVVLIVCYAVRLTIHNNAVKKGEYKEHKKVILSLALVITGIGAVSACFCVIALLTGQPYHVWYMFMMLGFYGCGWGGLSFLINKLMKKQIVKSELNKTNIDESA